MNGEEQEAYPHQGLNQKPGQESDLPGGAFSKVLSQQFAIGKVKPAKLLHVLNLIFKIVLQNSSETALSNCSGAMPRRAPLSQ